jgi:hypothetical protein
MQQQSWLCCDAPQLHRITQSRRKNNKAPWLLVFFDNFLLLEQRRFSLGHEMMSFGVKRL